MELLQTVLSDSSLLHYEIAKCIPQEEIPLLYNVLRQYSLSEQAEQTPFRCQVRELYLLPSLMLEGDLPLLQTVPELFFIEYGHSGNQSRYLLHKKWKSGHQYGENSTIISKKQCKKILNQDIRFMKNSEDQLLLEYYSKHQIYEYCPAFVISCKRKRHLLNNGQLQVTIDNQVQLSFHTSGFFQEKSLPAATRTCACFRVQSLTEI